MMSEIPTNEDPLPTQVPAGAMPVSDVAANGAAVPVTTPKFSPLALIGGLLLSLFFGAAGNVVADLAGASSGTKALAFLVGLIPGLVFVGVAALLRRRMTAFATGLFIGGCIIGLIGGICGASLVGMSFH